MKLIDKDAVVAEIKERINRDNEKAAYYSSDSEHDYFYRVKESVYKDLLKFLNTLEVKEVNLEKHLKEDIEDVFFDLDGVAVKGATHYITVEDVKDLAKHFYELGLKAQKGK